MHKTVQCYANDYVKLAESWDCEILMFPTFTYVVLVFIIETNLRILFKSYTT